MAQGLYDISPLEPLIEEGYTLLTPNQRLARRIRAQWDARQVASGKRVWEPLAVQPLDSWLLGQWESAVSQALVPPLIPLSSAQALEIWRQVIYQQQRQSQDYHLLSPAAAAEQADKARDRLQRWQVDLQSPAIRQSFELDRDCGTFLQWLTLFEQRLARAGQCTLVDCLRQLPGLAGCLPTQRIALLEVEEIPPLIRASLKAFGAELREVISPDEPGDRLLHSFPGKRAELETVAIWAARVHRNNPDATIGIVLSDMSGDRVSLEYLLRREFDCLGNNYSSLPVNFSTGIPLAQAPLVRDALEVLAMGLQYTTVKAIVRLLHSRFLALPDAQSPLAQYFVTRLYAEGCEVLPLAQLRHSATGVHLGDHKGLVLGKYLHTLSRMRKLRAKALPSQWAGYFREVLSLWGWPGSQPLDSLEYQQLDLWYRTLDEFRAFDAVCAVLDFQEALELLRSCCRRQISQPQTADSPVQVLGPLEAAGLSFEQIWLVGAQRASWPASPRPNPFIPVGLQARLQMPHATFQREWSFSEALLARYTRSCQTLHASYSRQIDGIVEPPSGLFQAFTQQELPVSAAGPAQYPISSPAGVLEGIHDQRAPIVGSVSQTPFKGGSSLLEDQSQCPFRGFSRHRLLVEPLAAFNVALSAQDRGSLLHGALFALWGEIGDHTSLLALNDSQQQHSIDRSVQAAITALPESRRQKLSEAFWQLERRRMAALLREWLAVERQRGAFSVVHREQDITLELGQLCLEMRVDRVDQLPDGSRVIIDYKSGVSRVQEWMGDRPAKPQLLLYAIAEPDSAAALAFAQVRPRECRYVGLGRVAAAPGISTDISRVGGGQMDTQDWQSLNERWREHLERIVSEFVAGDASVDPVRQSGCKACGLQPLCRVDMGEAFAATAEE